MIHRFCEMDTRVVASLGLASSLVLSLGLASVAKAASDGGLGLNSVGSSELSISKGDVVLITAISDIEFGTWITGSGNQSGTGQACVYSSTGAYSVMATSTAGNGGFALSDGEENALAYELNWTSNGAEPLALTNGQATPASLAAAAQTDCADSGGVNASFEVSIAEADLEAVPVGSYTDTLTLMVAPQ